MIQSRDEYVARIGTANQSQLVLITYELLLSHLDTALSAPVEYCPHTERARMAINALMGGLDMSQGVAGELLPIYMFIDRLLVRAYFSGDTSPLIEAREHCLELYKILKLAEEGLNDNSPKSSTEVYAGLTYGRDGLSEYVIQDGARTFKG